MNGYKLLADGYKQLAEKKPEFKEDFTLQIEALETVGKYNEEDWIYALFATGAFNDICKAYAATAIKSCNKLSQEEINDIMYEMNHIFDMKTASEVMKDN